MRIFFSFQYAVVDIDLPGSWAAQSTEDVDAQAAMALDLNDATLLNFDSSELASEFDTNYGLLAPQQTVLVRPYSDDTDDRMLAEIQPRFIVMYEPNMDFIRRIEACPLPLPLIPILSW